MQHRRPLVTLKAAVTLDGRLAARGGDARWVTGERRAIEAHACATCPTRSWSAPTRCALDDPALTTRFATGRGHDPQRVILDGRLSISPRRQGAAGRAGRVPRRMRDAARRRALEQRGAEVAAAAGTKRARRPARAARRAGRRELVTLLVEGGGQVHGAFIAAGLVDEVALFVAPKLIGAGGVPLLGVDGPAKMADAWRARRRFDAPPRR